jgi:Zn-finger nucleic acid-binding protein
MEARSIRCPQCGAATRSRAARCPYCRARLATVSCPGCLGLMFTDAEFCGSCGARRSRRAEPAHAPCPGCRGSLHGVSVGDVGILECTECDGLWLDAAAFERICADREAQAAVIHGGEGRTPGIEKRVSYRPCVRCGTMMNRVNFARLSGTIVDVCKGHGTFLDAGELQAIVGFIQGGGLDRARQRQIEDLKEQERRLKDQEARALSGRYSTATGPLFVDTGMRLGFDTLIGLFRNDA